MRMADAEIILSAGHRTQQFLIPACHVSPDNALVNTIVTKEIPDEDIEGVVNCFEKIKNSMMEEVYE